MTPGNIDPRATFTGEEVAAMLSRALHARKSKRRTKAGHGHGRKLERGDPVGGLEKQPRARWDARGKSHPPEAIMGRSAGHAAEQGILRMNARLSAAAFAKCSATRLPNAQLYRQR